jgi:tRNA-Thr(GGU) m(6)t(6)A37 methyltransferase TsaA
MSIAIQPIAFIRTPYKQKFAVPRQPGLADAAQGRIEFTPAFNNPDYIRGIQQFSHLWLIFQFHQTTDAQHSPLIRPPRLGGNQKIGVFASRSTHRPNNLGLSVVKLTGVAQEANQQALLVSGMDIVDNTPIIDIKPYLPYADAIADANAGYAQHPPPDTLTVSYTPQSQISLEQHRIEYPHLAQVIQQVLSQDPRPAYQQGKDPQRLYGVRLFDFDVRWRVTQQHCLVEQIQLLKSV